MLKKISIIIPVYNSEGTFAECLDALARNSFQDYEVIIVDDVSTDRSIEIAGQYGARIIRLEKNSGPAAARNRGAAIASGEILFFMDSDVIIPENTLSIISSTFEDMAIAAITGLFCDKQRYSNFSSDYKNMWMHHTYANLKEKASVFYTSGAAVRREIFLRTGRFDEKYVKPSIEDTDFGHRLKDAGYDVIVRKDFTYEHMKSYSLGGVLRTDFHRSSALTRMFLRRGLPWKIRSNSSSVPTSFITSVFLFFIACSLLVLGAAISHRGLLLVSTVVFFAYLFVNHSFIAFLWKKKGIGFAMRSIAVMTIDTVAAGLGIAHGCVGYLNGHKY